MTLLHALYLGIIQGLTEFLPVSSSGHLVLMQRFLGMTEDMMVFDIFVHFGTLCAVFVVFRSSISTMIFASVGDVLSCKKGRRSIVECLRGSTELSRLIAIVIGTVPAVLVVLTLDDVIEHMFTSVLYVLVALGVTGTVLILTFLVIKGNRQITVVTGLIIGMAQACAIVPGVSRSGATIAMALFLGIRRDEAGEFSFLLSIPAILGATLLAVLDVIGMEQSIDYAPYIVGMVSSFLVGWIALVVLMHVVKKGKIGWFGFYCLALSLAGIILYNTGMAGIENTQKTLPETVVTSQIAEIPSSYDGAMQHVVYYEAVGEKRPLLVALHTWSNSYAQNDVSDEYVARCRERDWHCVFPDFRGPNNRPEACGSEAAMQDILDAVNWAQENFSVDPRRVFLVDASGGGFMTLQMAGNHPTIWTAVSAWVPITDLKRWHEETTARELKYAGDIEQACGGAPGTSPTVNEEYKKRSALTSLWRANIIPTDINAGIHDGHGGTFGGEGSVPVGHAIRAFNVLAKEAGTPEKIVSDEAIGLIEENEQVPEYIASEVENDPDYPREIHLRRTSGLARLTLFEGGHEILYDTAFAWLERF